MNNPTAQDTRTLLAALEAGIANGIGLSEPTNATTGRPYTGGNVERLDGLYTSNAWAGFAQWKKAGRVILKGTKAGGEIVFFKTSPNKVDEDGKPLRIMRKKSVFAFEQTVPRELADALAGIAALVAPREVA